MKILRRMLGTALAVCMLLSLMPTAFAAATFNHNSGAGGSTAEVAIGNYGKAASDAYSTISTDEKNTFIYNISGQPSSIAENGYVVYECDFLPLDNNLKEIYLSVGTKTAVGNTITGGWTIGRWNHLMIAVSDQTKSNSNQTVTTNEIIATINGKAAALGGMGGGKYASINKNFRLYVISNGNTTVGIDNQKITEVTSGVPAYEMPAIAKSKEGVVLTGTDVDEIASEGETVRVYDIVEGVWTQKTEGIVDADDTVVAEKDGILNYFTVGGNAKTWNETILVESYAADNYSAYEESTLITNNTKQDGVAGKLAGDKLTYLPRGAVDGDNYSGVNMRFTLTAGAIQATDYVILEADVLPVDCDSVKLTLNSGNVVIAGGFINVPENVWSRVTMIYDMSADKDNEEAVKVYINGDLDQRYRKGSLSTTTTSFRLGFCNNSDINDYNAQGYLDNIRLTANTYAFTDSDVKTACTGGLTEGKTSANSIVDGNDIFVAATEASAVTEGTVLDSSLAAVSNGTIPADSTLAVENAASFLTAAPEGIKQMRSYHLNSYLNGGIGIGYENGGNTVAKAVYAGSSGTILLAQFDEGNALINVTSGNVAANGILKKAAEVLENTKWVRAYVWDSMMGLTPLAATPGEIVK